MTATEIRETLTEVGHAVDVPPVDEVAFRARVRGERRRRTAGRVLAAAGVAAAVAVGALTVLDGGGAGDRLRDPDAAGSPGGAVGAGSAETVWFVLDGRLTALDPRGVVHETDLRSEGVVGYSAERVYALDDESHVVVKAVTYDDEGARVPTFRDVPSPVPGAVNSVAMSGDDRYLAWLDLDDTLHRYDLKAGRVDLELDADPGTYLAGVSADGFLVSEGRDQLLRTAGATIEIPTQGDGYGAASDVAMGSVLVPDRDGRSRLYDVSGGSAELARTFEGFGVLGPYAERVATLVEEPEDGRALQVWDGGRQLGVAGLDAVPDQVQWADEVTLLVAAHVGSEGRLYSCDIDLRCTRLAVEGDVSLGG